MKAMKKNKWLSEIDEDWLAEAVAFTFEETAEESPEAMLDSLFSLKEEQPHKLINILHQSILSLILNQCEPYLEKKLKQTELGQLRRSLLEELAGVDEMDMIFDVPNHALNSSAAFAALLIQERVLPEIILAWDYEVQEVMGFITTAVEMWNLIHYYGGIPQYDLPRMLALSHREEDPFPEYRISSIIHYIHLNLTDEILIRSVDGEEWLVTEYAGAEPDEILEDIRKRGDLDYKPVDPRVLREMFFGITPFETLKVLEYLSASFKTEGKGEELLSDIEFLHAMVVQLRSRHGEEMPDLIRDTIGWEWDTKDPEARQIIFQELLDHTARFQLKGYSQAELNGEEAEEDPYLLEEEEEPFFEDEDIPEEFNFKIRRKKDDDGYLN